MRRFAIGADAPHPKIGLPTNRQAWENDVKIARNFLKRFVAIEPQFRSDPSFTAVRTKGGVRLRREVDGTTFDLLPWAFGLDPEKLHNNDRIALDLDGWLGQKSPLAGIAKGWLKRHVVRWVVPGLWGNEHLMVGSEAPTGGFQGAFSKDGLTSISKWVRSTTKRKLRAVPQWKIATADDEAFIVVGGRHIDWDLVSILYGNAAGPLGYVPVDTGCEAFVIFEGDVPIAVVACLAGDCPYKETGRAPFVAPKVKKSSPFTSILAAAEAALERTTKEAKRTARRKAA